jgi:hypothetical protein
VEAAVRAGSTHQRIVCCALSVGCGVLLLAVTGCGGGANAGREQALAAMQSALSSRYAPDGPSMGNDAEPAGTHEPELTQISADSALPITLISASLIPLPGFGLPRLLSTGVVAGGCPGPNVAFPSANGLSVTVTVGGHPYKPLPLAGYRMLIGAGCVPQILYVIEAKTPGQYAVGGLRVLVQYDGHTRTMFAYDGVDVWFYGSGPLPSPDQVTHGLQAAFAAQMAVYRADGQ